MVAWRAMLARSPNRLVFDTAIRGKCCSSSATIIDCARLDLEILGAKSPTRSLNTNNALVLSSLPSSKIAILSGIERNIHLRLQADPLLQFSYTAWHERAYLQARYPSCVFKPHPPRPNALLRRDQETSPSSNILKSPRPLNI